MVQLIVTILLIALLIYILCGVVFTFFLLPGDYKK